MRRFKYDYNLKEMVEIDCPEDRSNLLIMPDIKPYQSMITGEEITSRSKHREHLRNHGMIEVGNDSSLTKPYTGMPDTNPKQRKEILRHEVNKFTEKEWRKAGERHRQEVIRYMERNGKD